MAFPTTSMQPLTAIAKVTVRFSGLILLKPGAGNHCEIGINRFSSDHAFQVILIVKKPQRPPTLIRLVTGPLTRPFLINVTPDPHTGVQAFAPTSGTFVRSSTSNNDLDFRWALDLRESHPGIDFNDGALPGAKLNAGTLYTPTLTNTALNLELVQGAGTTPGVRLGRIAGDLAAAISTLPPNTTVELTWDELGEPRRLSLPRRFDLVDTTYTIAFLNDPPTMSSALHDELGLYYKVLQIGGAPVPIAARRRLRFTPPPTTDEIPCMPVVLNQ
ncbi:MAG TPA: hypothetical protein VFI24_12035 [Pyrinomonadaceae bacterium]|nr:hypothetical protein [Pyrinomonadaceae bacterium]